MSPDRILITGASGFIGKWLLGELKSRDYMIVSHSSKDGDLSSCTLAYKNIRHVFHLAGRSFVPDSWKDPREFYRVNLLGTINVLEFCRLFEASLTYISSYVYGRPHRIPISEDHPLEAFNPYGHSKILAEDACRFYSTHFGLKISVVRPFNIYGPGQDRRFLIPLLVRQALDPDSATIEVADDRPRRDFLFVSDLARLLTATFEHGGSGAYNAGSGVSTGIGEIVDILNTLVACPKVLVSRKESRPQEVMDLSADIGKAGRELHWQPTVDIVSGLRYMIEHERG